MKDMRAAGLNPILSYQTGVPGTVGSGIGSGSEGAGAGVLGAAKKGLEGITAVQQARLTGAQADIAGSQAVSAKIKAEWDAEHPGLVQGSREAEVRQITGGKPIDQAIGGGLQGLRAIKPWMEQRFEEYKGIIPNTAEKIQKFFQGDTGAGYWKRKKGQ